MDPRLYIFAGALGLFLAAVAFLISSIVRFVRGREQRIELLERMGAGEPQTPRDALRSPSPADGSASPFGAPMRTGVWQPQTPREDAPIELSPVAEIIASLEREESGEVAQPAERAVPQPEPAAPSEAPHAPGESSDSPARAVEPPVEPPEPAAPSQAPHAPPSVAPTPPQCPEPVAAPPAPAVRSVTSELLAPVAGPSAAPASPESQAPPEPPERCATAPAGALLPQTVPSVTTSMPLENAGDYELAAQVELWFGQTRVGAKPGSRAHNEFVRLANALLEEFRRASEV